MRWFLPQSRWMLIVFGLLALQAVAADVEVKRQPDAKQPPARPQISIREILEKETVTDADYKALQESMKLSDERLARLKQQLEQVRKTQQREREEMAKLAKDPRAQPSHELWKVLTLERRSPGDAVTNYCMDQQQRLLVCCGPQQGMPRDGKQQVPLPPSDTRGIHVLSLDGQTQAVWKLDFTPQAICIAPQGLIFAAGGGRIAKLDSTGKVLCVDDTPQAAQRKQELAKKAAPPGEKAAIKSVDDEQPSVSLLSALWGALTGSSADAKRREQDQQRARFEAWYYSQVSGLAANEKDLFVCSPSSGGFTVYRVDHEFGQPKKLLQGLAGCCGQMDIHTRGDELYVAENGRFRVSRYDRDGKLLSSWGRGERVGVEGFSGCCNPKNIRFAQGDVVYTAESGPPHRVKRHTLDGKFLDVVALPKFAGGCVRVTVAASADGNRVYVLDTSGNQIQAYMERGALPKPKQVSALAPRESGSADNVGTSFVGYVASPEATGK